VYNVCITIHYLLLMFSLKENEYLYFSKDGLNKSKLTGNAFTLFYCSNICTFTLSEKKY